MFRLKENHKCICCIIRILMNKHQSSLFILSFVNYVYLRLIRLFKLRIKLNLLDEKEFQNEVVRYCNDKKFYIDSNSCAFGNISNREEFASWYYLCSSLSHKIYKILIINVKSISRDNIYLSNTMRINIENALRITNSNLCSFFVYSAIPVRMMYATEVILSQIKNVYECPSDFINFLLQNHFSRPRYLRSQDIFSIEIREYCPDYYYSDLNPDCAVINFQVRSIKKNNFIGKCDGFYVMQEKTTLILKSNIRSYLPTNSSNMNFKQLNKVKNNLVDQHLQCPPNLEDPLHQLEASISPFLQKDIGINMNPIFLIEGPEGSGKFKLVQIVARRLGFHLYDVDFREMQTLTSVQTEAKLRIAISKAESSIPCIFCFRNIQVFGINTEGKKDDRIIFAFKNELKRMFGRNNNYPLIVIVTSESSDLPSDLKRLFLEKIFITYLNQTERSNLLLYLLKRKGILHKADLFKIAGVCSDFVLADFEVLILQAMKTKYDTNLPLISNESCPTLLDDDFNNAYDYMQSMFSDRFGTPRVPKVYWEDIGGLGDLKHEIIKRIELPLLNDIGIGHSGLLLYGPPGTGKTLLAKAVATEYQLNFFSVKGPELLNMYVGQSEKNVRQVFERARAAAPCIIFFDELDSLAPNRGQNGDSGGVMDRVVSQLLAEIDGLESSNNIFIIGATNRPDLIDPALLRPGRFDKMLYVGVYSDKYSQISVLKALTRKFKLKEGGKELEVLVETLPSNLTGADLYSICSNAWLLAVRKILMEKSNSHVQETKICSSQILFKKEIVVELEDFITATENMIPSVSVSELVQYEKSINRR